MTPTAFLGPSLLLGGVWIGQVAVVQSPGPALGDHIARSRKALDIYTGKV